MQTVAPSQTCRHTTIRIATEHPTQFIDLTSDLEAFVAASGRVFLVELDGPRLREVSVLVLGEGAR